MEDEDDERARVMTPENERIEEDLMVTTLGNVGREAFKGRSNILFDEDFLNDGEVVIEFSDTEQVRQDLEFDVDRWTSHSPFSVGVRIVEYNQPSSARFHLPLYSLMDVRSSYSRLEGRLTRFEFIGLQNKTRGLTWKHKAKRRYDKLTEMESRRRL